MAIDNDHDRNAGVELLEPGSSSISDFAADLSAFVDRLEADCQSGRTIGKETADELLGLRNRAEQLLETLR